MPEGRLQVTDSQGRRIVPLDRPLFLIGRRTTADLQLVNADVSREHAEIVRDEAGRYILRDRASRYGSFVNGEQVSERALLHGDTIRLGHGDAVEIVFLSEEDASSVLRGTSTDASDLAQMAAILNGLRALGSGRVLDEVLTLVIDSALEVTKAERGVVMMPDANGELVFKTARASGGVTLSGTAFTVSSKIPREVFETGTGKIVGDLLDGDLASAHGGTIAIGIRHVLCVPLRVFSRGGGDTTHIIGVLYLDSRERGTMLSPATMTSLEAFATQAALAIESARLYAESAEKARIDRDLRIAADIQRALLPDGTCERPAFDLAAVSVPCRTVGGDFYDYLDVSDREFGFALGDVAGKGPPAALLAAVVQSNFGALAPVTHEPAEMMLRLNQALLRRAIEARFATMCYGVATTDGQFRYCNAGQEPPLVIAADGVRWLETGGPVLGLLPSATYEYATEQLAPGDLVVVCSDGVTEARNVANEEFGRERLLAALRSMHGARPDAALEQLLSSVNQFARGTPQADDITALVFRYRGGSPGQPAAG
jgi:serine phosphatase RsbU (regulator of sigma subunit)/pSer/pThr/pTyr-binding forkhead associated (FHA) protein